jgi:hypothetical protein
MYITSGLKPYHCRVYFKLVQYGKVIAVAIVTGLVTPATQGTLQVHITVSYTAHSFSYLLAFSYLLFSTRRVELHLESCFFINFIPLKFAFSLYT